jgi:hypothetical protein
MSQNRIVTVPSLATGAAEGSSRRAVDVDGKFGGVGGAGLVVMSRDR